MDDLDDKGSVEWLGITGMSSLTMDNLDDYG